MKEIEVSDVRVILSEVIKEYEGLYKIGMQTPDDKFVKMNLRTDFGLDSLDIEDMFDKLYDLYGISVDMYNPLTEFAFRREQTVENFIDMVNTINRVNYNLSQKA